MNITKEFWDFIERNVPNYHTREDVLRQANLQVFIDDGDDTYVKGITREEAIKLRDSILFQLYHEAIDAFTSKPPITTTEEDSLRDYAEIIADIAYEAGVRQFRPSNNSRETISTIIDWANEFHKAHKDTDWAEVDYLETSLDFIEEKLSTAPHFEDSATFYTIASLNRAALQRHGYATHDLSNRDMYELAGLMGDSYCDSSQFSHDVHTACEMFGLHKNPVCPVCENPSVYDPQKKTNRCESCNQQWGQSYTLVEALEETDKLPDDIGYSSSEAQNSNARYISEYDYIHIFKKAPEPNSYYEPVCFPDSQKYMSNEEYVGDPACDSIQALNELINDEKGLEEFGENAYWVPVCNLK